MDGWDGGGGEQPGQRETSSFGTTAVTSCFFFFFYVLGLTPPFCLFFLNIFFSFAFWFRHSIMSLLSILFIIISGQFTFRVVLMGCDDIDTAAMSARPRLEPGQPIGLAVQGRVISVFFFSYFFFLFCAIMLFPQGGWDSSVYLSCKGFDILFIFGYFFFFIIGFTAPSPQPRSASVCVYVCAIEGNISPLRHQIVRDHCLLPAPPFFFFFFSLQRGCCFPNRKGTRCSDLHPLCASLQPSL